jgi:regulator of sigma E protease
MSIILFIIILVTLIVGHEFGHLLAAKRAGMKVPEFGIGFPPKLWGVKIGSTEYTINALPFGGFVRIVGEDGVTDDPNAFGKKSVWAQALTLFAGPFANIVLGFIAFWIAFMVGMPTALEDAEALQMTNTRVVVSELLPGSPAAESGLAVGDTVVSLEVGSVTTIIRSPKDIVTALGDGSEDVTVHAQRGATEHDYIVTPKAGIITDAPERKALGVGSLIVGTVQYGFFESIFKAGAATVNGLVGIVLGFGVLIAGLFTASTSIATLSGPVGIASLVGDAAYFGAGQVLSLTAIISLNLAVLNLLPFPALDGGRLALLATETVRGRPVKKETSEAINTVGFLLLITLMLVVTWQDITKLLS